MEEHCIHLCSIKIIKFKKFGSTFHFYWCMFVVESEKLTMLFLGNANSPELGKFNETGLDIDLIISLEGGLSTASVVSVPSKTRQQTQNFHKTIYF